MNFITTKEDEMMHLVKTVLTVILDDESIPTWSMGSEQYYRKLTDHVFKNDEELIEKIKDIAAMTRATYRSYPEFSNLQALVSCERETEGNGVDDVCCVCLQPLCNTWQKVIRLRTVDNDPCKCAHRLHKTCAMHLHLDEEGDLHCPLCRETVQHLPRQWIDQESKIPRF